jgi:triosephosphate isomerase
MVNSVTRLIAANWKMYKVLEEVQEFFKEFLPKVKGVKEDLVIFPPSVYLAEASRLAKGSNVMIGSQNVHFELQGAFTGEISLPMVQEFCQIVLIGHSERRQSETNDVINRKVKLVLGKGFKALLCVGERLEHRQLGETTKVLEEQLTTALRGVPAERLGNLTIAYEPVWAIGTGANATVKQAEESHAFIRSWLEGKFPVQAKSVRILYGGSVTPEEAGKLAKGKNIDGFLVGGASLNPSAFVEIVKAAATN